MTVSSLPIPPKNERIALPQLAHEQGVSPVSVWRWAVKGYRGLLLPTVCLGKKRYTTRAAFSQWCEAVTAASNAAPLHVAPRARSAAVERAEREAAKLGCV